MKWMIECLFFELLLLPPAGSMETGLRNKGAKIHNQKNRGRKSRTDAAAEGRGDKPRFSFDLVTFFFQSDQNQIHFLLFWRNNAQICPFIH